MKGYNIISDAAALSGVSAEANTIRAKGLVFLNMVLCEMGFIPIKSLGAHHGLPAPARQTATLGCAMLISSAVGDTESAAAFSEGYNLALSRHKGRVDRVVPRAFRRDSDEV